MRLRGGSGNSDKAEMLQQVVHFFEAHADARFTWMHRMKDDRRANTMQRAGFKRFFKKEGETETITIDSNEAYMAEYGENMSDADAEKTELEFLVLPEVFRKE